MADGWGTTDSADAADNGWATAPTDSGTGVLAATVNDPAYSGTAWGAAAPDEQANEPNDTGNGWAASPQGQPATTGNGWAASPGDPSASTGNGWGASPDVQSAPAGNGWGASPDDQSNDAGSAWGASPANDTGNGWGTSVDTGNNGDDGWGITTNDQPADIGASWDSNDQPAIDTSDPFATDLSTGEASNEASTYDAPSSGTGLDYPSFPISDASLAQFHPATQTDTHLNIPNRVAADVNIPDRFTEFLLDPEKDEKKITEQVENRTPNSSTFTIMKESHTLANLLRAHLLKDEHVIFAGYKVPHPLFGKLELRVQTDGVVSPKDAVVNCCKNLVQELGQLSREFTKEHELRKMVPGNEGTNGY